jgi:predicted metal-dependent hydrolase
MSDTKEYQKYNLEIVYNKKLKHSYISISRDKKVVLKTPNKSKDFAEGFLEEKSAWIQKQLIKIDNLTPITREEIHTKEFIANRVEEFSARMQLPFRTLKFKKMKSRWGSCNSRREITLNLELIHLEKNLIDYVVVHELAHIRHMNHSKSFHQLVEEFLPDAKEYRKELKNIKFI